MFSYTDLIFLHNVQTSCAYLCGFRIIRTLYKAKEGQSRQSKYFCTKSKHLCTKSNFLYKVQTLCTNCLSIGGAGIWTDLQFTRSYAIRLRDPTRSHAIPRDPTRYHAIPRDLPRDPRSHAILRDRTRSTRSHAIPRDLPRDPRSHAIYAIRCHPTQITNTNKQHKQ